MLSIASYIKIAYCKIKSIFQCLVDIVYKEECIICNRVVKNNKYICKECLNKILVKNIGKTRNIVTQYDIIYVARYSKIKRYMINYKFNLKKYIGNAFTTLCIERINMLNIKFDYITAVPLSNEKRNLRGYNQSEFIAKKVAKNFNKEYIDILYKIKDNKTQSSLGKDERKENIKGLFGLNKEFIKKIKSFENKTIVLFDDVYTTGATIDECINIIRKAVDCKIIVVIVAINNNKL